MKEKLLQAMLHRKTGNVAYDKGDFAKAVAELSEAIEIINTISDREMPDRAVFLAGCKANLSGAVGALGRMQDALSLGREALAVYDGMGDLLFAAYRNELGDYLMARFNVAAALMVSGAIQEAKAGFSSMKNWLEDNKVGFAEEYKAVWVKKCDANLQRIRTGDIPS